MVVTDEGYTARVTAESAEVACNLRGVYLSRTSWNQTG